MSLGPSLRERFPEGLPAPPPPPPPPPPPRPTMTEGEVMAAAFSDQHFDPSEVEIVARVAHPPAARPKVPASEPGEPEEPEVVPERAAERDPETVAEPVDPELARADEALRQIRARAWTGQQWRDAPPPPPEERAELRAEERQIIDGAGRCSWVPTLRIRGLSRARALVDLADFVTLHQAAGRPYVRVITGKGVGSRREPVLKHALVSWCAGEGVGLVRGIAPEREATLEFGAFVLALHRRRG